MSRTSRIERRPGSRFLSIFAQDIGKFGLAAATVIALLDFFDRAQAVAGQSTTSRARIVADLEGFVGRNAVDAALAQLLELGIIKKHTEIEMGNKNYLRTVSYSLCAPALTVILQGTPDIGNSGDSLNRELRELPVPGPEQGVPSICLKEERSSSSTSPNIFTIWPAGLHCWTPADQLAAAELIAKYGLGMVASVVNKMDAEPLPGRVRRQLEQLARAQRTAAKRAATAAPAPKAHLDIDPAARAAGEAMLSKIRSKKSNQKGAST